MHYDFDTAGVLEIWMPKLNGWYRVTSREFRSYDGKRRITKPIKPQGRNEIYNVSAENHMKNLEVVDEILKWYGKDRNQIQFVENRWGQDLRYSISAQKIRNLGWKPHYINGIYRWF